VVYLIERAFKRSVKRLPEIVICRNWFRFQS